MIEPLESLRWKQTVLGNELAAVSAEILRRSCFSCKKELIAPTLGGNVSIETVKLCAECRILSDMEAKEAENTDGNSTT